MIPPVTPAAAAPSDAAAASGPQPAPGGDFHELLRRAGAEPARVASTRTPLSAEQATSALAEAWSAVVGDEPGAGTLDVLTAHWAHETDHGRQMRNFNFAGLKGTGPSGLTAECSTREGYGATERRIVDRFRAYTSPAEGARDYVSLLARRYPAAVDAARRGDPLAFSEALREGRYFTGDPRAYATRLAALSGQSGAGALGGPGAAVPFLGTAPDAPAVGAPSGMAPDVPYPGERGEGGALAAVDPLALYEVLARASLRLVREPEPQGAGGATRSGRS